MLNVLTIGKINQSINQSIGQEEAFGGDVYVYGFD